MQKHTVSTAAAVLLFGLGAAQAQDGPGTALEDYWAQYATRAHTADPGSDPRPAPGTTVPHPSPAAKAHPADDHTQPVRSLSSTREPVAPVQPETWYLVGGAGGQ